MWWFSSIGKQGGRQLLAEAGYRLHAVFTFSEVLHILQEAEKINVDEVTAVHTYLATS